jgi:hypothetical protein
MQNYVVEVPVYLRLELDAPTAEVAAEAASDFAATVAGTTVRPGAIINGLFIKSQRLELLNETEDHAPDVYLRVGAREVFVELAA